MELVEHLVERRERKSLFWWTPKDGSVNVGDHLSKVLVSSLLALQDTNLLRKRPGTPRLLCIGSVLHFATGGEVVWGTGINGKIPAEAHRFTTLDVRAVRGPKTRQVLADMGISVPQVYGDPALLTPRFFDAELLGDKRDKKPFLVVPHFNEPLDKYAGYEDLLVSPRIEPGAFISQLLGAERIVSSSLHGVILAEAYGIPAVYLDWGNGEDRFKYDDYYAGTGRQAWRSGTSVEECLDIGGNADFDLAAIQRGLMDTFPTISGDPMLVFSGQSQDITLPGDPIWLGGLPIASTTLEPFADALLQTVALRERRNVFFANTNFVVQCRGLRKALHGPSVTIVNDGIGLDLAALLIHRKRFAANLNGTDLIPSLCTRSKRPLRFFLLGAKPGVAAAAAATLERVYGQDVVGICDGYGQMREQGEALVQTINRAQPDVLLVALGNPVQEQWILEHSHQLEVPLAFGVGALLDFLSGHARRAPAWIQRIHMEWAFRLLHEPRRLLKRYSVDLVTFFAVCIRARKLAPASVA